MVARSVPGSSELNVLCAKCRRACRQPKSAVLVDCPRFLPFPFKVERNRFEQIDLFASNPSAQGD